MADGDILPGQSIGGTSPVGLPIDMPPFPGRGNVAGITTTGSLGQKFFPFYAKPWTMLQSKTFPKSLPSAVSPNGMRPTYGYSINAYSPVAHRSGLTDVIPTRITSAFPTAATPTQRPRGYAVGYVTAWPQSAPRWPTWRESGRARSG